MLEMLPAACHNFLEEVAKESPLRHAGQFFLEDSSNQPSLPIHRQEWNGLRTDLLFVVNFWTQLKVRDTPQGR